MARAWGRLLTAMVTPFTEGGAVDEARSGELARALLDSGSDGLVLTGTTGECPTLSIEEQVGVWRAVRSALGPEAQLVAGASTNSTAESLEMVEAGAGVDVDALMLTVPYYNKPSQAGLVRHFSVLAEATALPCILYNVPSRTAVNMTAETTARLADVPNIVGVKEASGDLGQIAEIIERTAGTEFRVWSGNDADTLPLLALGGYGVVSVASHLVGRQIARMIRGRAGRPHAGGGDHPPPPRPARGLSLHREQPGAAEVGADRDRLPRGAAPASARPALGGLAGAHPSRASPPPNRPAGPGVGTGFAARDARLTTARQRGSVGTRHPGCRREGTGNRAVATARGGEHRRETDRIGAIAYGSYRASPVRDHDPRPGDTVYRRGGATSARYASNAESKAATLRPNAASNASCQFADEGSAR